VGDRVHPATPGSSLSVSLAFLGCGWATRLHSRTLRAFRDDVELYYASRDAARARQYRERFRGVGAFHSYDEGIADPRVQAVLIATPPSTHLELTLRALRGGKHVIVEKPAFLRSADFDTVAAAERESGRRVLVAENYYYKPITRRLRGIVASGALGEILFVHVNALKYQQAEGWRGDAALAGGGALFEAGIHWINFIANLGLEVRSVRGLRPGARETRGEAEKSILVSIEYAEGAVGVLSYSWEIPSLYGLRVSRIYGREGSVTFESNGVFLVQSGRRKALVIPGLRDLAGYRAMFADFLRALSTGAPTEFTLAHAQRDVELVEQVYRSMRGAGSG
jgi:predicted dehydrogenase